MMNTSRYVIYRGHTYRSRLWLLLLVALMLGGSIMPGSAFPVHAATDVGYRDFSFAGAPAPTADKPQSKLWFNDGIWWGNLFNSATKKYDIYRFNWSTNTWSDTGTVIDARSAAHSDALWDGTYLYVASAVIPGTTTADLSARVSRYSYNPTTKSYTLDSGFPVTLFTGALETIVLDKDTTGTVWVTFTYDNGVGGRNVYVTHTTSNDTSWQQPYVLPVTGAGNLKADDISAVVAFNGRIGVMWSNQNDNAMYFAIHRDGDPDNVWQTNPAVQGRKYADDHINLKSLQADASGQVFAVTKTSLNNGSNPNPNAPLILLMVLDQRGGWSRRTVWRVQYDVTRPLVLLDNQNRQVYVFATSPEGGGAIYYKQVGLDNASLQFGDGIGTPFIQLATDPSISNPTSTKQALNSTTGLLVLAGDGSTKYYVHNTMNLGGSTSSLPAGSGRGGR